MFGCTEGLRAKALCSIIQCCPAWQLVWCVIVTSCEFLLTSIKAITYK